MNRTAHTLKSLLASIGFSLSANAQDLPAGTEFMQRLSNGQSVAIDCDKLSDKKKTVAFVAQYEPVDEEELKKLPPFQQAWIRQSHENRSTDANMIRNLETHIEADHGVKKTEIDAAYKACLTLSR